MTEVYGATSHKMTEVGGVSRMMKVRGATKSTLTIASGNLIISVLTDEMVYFEAKITTQDEGDMCHHNYDRRIDSGKISSGYKPALE